MRVIEDFISEELVKKIDSIIHSNIGDYKWSTNLFWKRGVVENSNFFVTYPLHKHKEIYDELKDSICSIVDPSLSCEEFLFNYTIFTSGAYIPWHDDGSTFFAATIYLNENWNSEDGGLLLYKREDDEIVAIVPKYRRIVVNNLRCEHHVTMVCPHAKQYRTTIQVWVAKNKYPQQKKFDFAYS